MNTNQIIEVYEIFKKKFSIEDSMEIMSFIEDSKYNSDSISTQRKFKVCDIFNKVFSFTDTYIIVNYILTVNVKYTETVIV